METIPVRIVDISFLSKESGFMVFLEIMHEKLYETPRILPLIIGLSQGEKIVTQMSRFKMDQFLTIDLAYDILGLLNYKVYKVVIDYFVNEAFYASIFIGKKSKKIKLNSRPSDAILLSLQLNIPIFITKALLEVCQPVIFSKYKNYMLYPYQEIDLLKEKLKIAVNNENYEQAAKLRNKLHKLLNRKSP